MDSFLKEFKLKAKIFDIVFYRGGKNDDTLLQIGISAKKREELIMEVDIENYYRGPTADDDPDRPVYFEFGVQYNRQEIYIKLSLGKFDNSPHCMSFHIAERPLNYPLRK